MEVLESRASSTGRPAERTVSLRRRLVAGPRALYRSASRLAERWAIDVAWEELREFVDDVRERLGAVRPRHVLLALLVAAVVAILAEEVAILSVNVLMWIAVGALAGMAGISLGIFTVKIDQEAKSEAKATAKRSFLPLRLRSVLKIIFIAVVAAGIVGAILSGALSIVLIEVFRFGTEQQVRLFNQSLELWRVLLWFNLVVLLGFCIRNHFKTRGTGGWARAEDHWNDGDPADGWSAIRALL
jgi:hypothetical protein